MNNGRHATTGQTRHETRAPEETEAVARALAAELQPGAVIALHGQLGAGKTCFVRGLAEGLRAEGPVTSPTYTLVQEYAGPIPLNHIDLYRIRAPSEALGFGLDEIIEGGGVTAIEWAERIEALLPPESIHVCIEPGAAEEDRILTITRSPSC